MAYQDNKDIQMNKQSEDEHKMESNTSIEYLSKINELKTIIVKKKLSNYIKTEVSDYSAKYPRSLETSNVGSIKHHRNNSLIQSKNGRIQTESSSQTKKQTTIKKSVLSSPNSPYMMNKRNIQSRSICNKAPEELNASFIIMQKGYQQPRARSSLPSCLSAYKQQKQQIQQTSCDDLKADQTQTVNLNSNQSGMRIRKVLVSQKKMNSPLIKDFDRDSENSNTYRSLSRCQSRPQGVVYENHNISPQLNKKRDNIINSISQTMDYQKYSNALCQQLTNQQTNKIILTCPDSRMRNKSNLYYHQQVREQLSRQSSPAQLDLQKQVKTEIQYLEISKSDEEINSFSCLDTCHDGTQTTTLASKVQSNSSQQQIEADQIIQSKKIIDDCNLIQKQPGFHQTSQKDCNINSDCQSLNQNRYLPKMFKYQNIKLKQSIKNNQKILQTPPKEDKLGEKMKVISVYNYNRAIRTSYSPESVQDLASLYNEAKQIISRPKYSNLIQNNQNSFSIKVTTPSLQSTQVVNV